MQKTLKKLTRFDVDYVKKNGSWLLVGHVFTMLCTVFTSYVFANYLNAEVYGTYKYLVSIGAILSAITLTGAGMAIAQASAKKITGFFSLTTKKALSYELSLSFVALIVSGYYFLQDNTTLALGLLLIALIQPFFNNSKLIHSYLLGSENFSLMTKLNIFKTLLSSISLIIITLLVENALLILITFLLFNTLFNYIIFLFHRPKEQVAETNNENVRPLITYAKHTSIRNALSITSNHLDKILIFQQLNAVDLAVYTFATALPDQFNGITKGIKTLLLPRFSRRQHHEVRSTIIYKITIYFFFLMILVSTYIIVAPTIFEYIFPDYADSVFLSQLFSIGTLFTIGSIPMTFLQAKLEESSLYKLQLSTAGIRVSLTLILLPVLGILGVILARVFTRFYSFIAALFLFYRISNK